MSFMNLSVGIVGLPNSGKSTLFNALLKRKIAAVAEYPFTTIEPNVGVVQVPDERLEKISRVTIIEKIVPAAVKFVDIAGLVKGAHKGEGLGNEFLGHIRDVDILIHLLRYYDIDLPSRNDPIEDLQIVNLELELDGIEKPTLYCLNITESKLKNSQVQEVIKKISQVTRQNIDQIITLCAKLEAEIDELPENEREAYLKELGVDFKSGLKLDKIITNSYKLLNLITFFTIVGRKQVQAWSIRAGETALTAAGIVHTDMQKGFIRAEVISWQKLVEVGNWTAAHEQGLVKLVSKGYLLTDGDIIEFKFS